MSTTDEPTTTLDERFSESGAAATAWATTVAALEDAQISWISTVRADGRPHVTPLVAVWADGAAYFCTGPTEQKAINLERNPAVVLTTGCNDWERGLDVMVEGSAERVTDLGTLERLAAAWRDKWDGSWQFEARDDGFYHDNGGLAYVFRIAPVKVLSFAKGESFSHTTHRFDR